MNDKLTRRNFLAASAAGAASLILPAASALANETISLFDISEFIPDIPVSGDSEIRKKNAIALEKWETAVREALRQGGEICLDQKKTEPDTYNYMVPGCAQDVSMWNIPCTIEYIALYDTASDETIGNVYDITAHARYWGPVVDNVNSFWVKTDNKKKLAALFTINVTWDPRIYPAHTETIVTYAEYSSKGFVLSC